MTVQTNNSKKILSLLRRPVVYHSVVWLVVLVFFTSWEIKLSEKPLGFFYVLSNNIIQLLILGGAVYYNIYALIPKYLAIKKGWQYFLLLIVLILIVTPIENFLLFSKSVKVPEMRAEILTNLDYSFVLNFFVIGTSTLVKITLDWFRGQREKQELQNETMQSELRFLKSQINPHFLFNTLNSLYALTLKKSDKAPDIVLKLSEMMRYMLYECNEPYVFLSKEVHYIKNYLDLEKLRQGKKVEIDFQVAGSISDQKIAPLMFMSFIENCFKHGLGNNISPGFVRITLNVTGQEIDARIENSKPESMPKPLHARSGGIGLVNVRRRLDLLYSGRYSLDIEDTPNTYAVNLKIQLEE